MSRSKENRETSQEEFDDSHEDIGLSGKILEISLLLFLNIMVNEKFC